MKMTAEHLSILKSGIDKVLKANPDAVDKYRRGEFPRSDRVKDLQRRFCFDLFHASGLSIGDGIGTHGEIIGDYNDDHIYTALRHICPQIEMGITS